MQSYYIKERPGIVQCVQIILLLFILGLFWYTLIHDERWNRQIKQKGLNFCVDLNRRIERKRPQVFRKVECERLKQLNLLQADCTTSVQQNLLRPLPPGQEFGTSSMMRKYMKKNLPRQQYSQIGFATIAHIILAVLVGHLLIANLTKKVEWKTKWNVALQGIILFLSSLSVMLTFIALSSGDKKYSDFTQVEVRCGILLICIKDYPVKDIPEDARKFIERELHDTHACQESVIKKVTGIMMACLAGTCLLMIKLIIDLANKIEQNEELVLIESEINEMEDMENHKIQFESEHPLHDDDQDSSETDLTQILPEPKPLVYFGPGSEHAVKKMYTMWKLKAQVGEFAKVKDGDGT